MSAELVPVQEYGQAVFSYLWDDHFELPQDQSDFDGGVYSDSGACSECGVTGVETYLGRCEVHAGLVRERAGDLLQPLDFNWTDPCQADCCGGRVQYENGLGACDTCGSAHRRIRPENYSKLFIG